MIQWNRQSAQGVNKDRWSQTYVAKPSTPQSNIPKRIVAQHSSPSLRPQGATALASRVSEHIASTTNSLPSSPVPTFYLDILFCHYGTWNWSTTMEHPWTDISTIKSKTKKQTWISEEEKVEIRIDDVKKTESEEENVFKSLIE